MNTTVNAAIDRALEKATLLYENVPIQFAVKSIPVIGPGLEAIFDGRLEQAREQRLRDWLRLVHGCMKALDEEKVDKAFLESEEFLALFMRTAKEASECIEKEKLSVFAQFLANGAVTTAGPGYRERTLAIISSLCMGHLMILRYAAETTTPPQHWDVSDGEPYFPLGTSVLVAPEERLEIAANEQVGFFQDLLGRHLLMRAGVVPNGDRRLAPGCVITDQGLEVVAMIRSSTTIRP
jgi:hypothetical protein